MGDLKSPEEIFQEGTNLICVSRFLEKWEDEVPELKNYTGWRNAKKHARSFQEVHSWLVCDMRDKFEVVAPEMVKDLQIWLDLER